MEGLPLAQKNLENYFPKILWYEIMQDQHKYLFTNIKKCELLQLYCFVILLVPFKSFETKRSVDLVLYIFT